MPGRHGKIVVGARAGRDQHEVGGKLFARLQPHAGRLGLAFDRDEARAEPEVHALLAMVVLEEIRRGGSGDALEHAVLGFQHGDLAALAHRDRGDFQADIAAAHDDDALGRVHGGPQLHDIVDLAQRVHAGEIDAGYRQDPRRGSGGEHQRGVVDLAPVGQRDAPQRRVDRADRRTEREADVVLAPERLRPQEQGIGVAIFGKELLRQGRALIREVGFLADHQDRPGMAALPQAHGELRAGLAGADDHNGFTHQASR